MSANDHETRIYRGATDPALGGIAVVEVEGVDGTYPLINHSDTDYAWGYGGGGPTNLAECLVIDTLGKDARCKRCSGGGIDPNSDREEAICRDCGGDGWSDIVALATPLVVDELIAPLESDSPFSLTSAQVMDIVLRLSLDGF